MSDLQVGQRVQVVSNRAIAKRYREYTFTVRALRATEVCVDDGDPGDPKWTSNGARVVAWIPLTAVRLVEENEIRDQPGVRNALLRRLSEAECARLRKLCLDAATFLDDLGTSSGDAMAARLRAAGGGLPVTQTEGEFAPPEPGVLRPE